LTGDLLRPSAREDGRVGLDMTFSSTKSVGIAREVAGAGNLGDDRIEGAHEEAVTYVFGLIEQDSQARVRVGGANTNRTTGNLIATGFTHRDTRINADDQMPDMSLHTHLFIQNATNDPMEAKWKAAELGQIKHDLPFYEAAFHNRLASNLKALGYGIERKGKAFEIAGVSRDTIEKFSRRTAYIEKVADKLGIVKPESKAKLGATTRLGKAKETYDDLSGYYASRLTEQERQGLAGLHGWAGFEGNAKEAVEFAIGHLFERKSVVDARKVYELALRRGIGSVTPEEVQAEARKQGLLTRGGEATTRQVLAEEERVIAFARDGRGTCRGMGMRAGLEPTSHHDNDGIEPSLLGTTPGRVTTRAAANSLADLATLSPDQQAICRHVWNSPDRVILIRGAAGTGKTHTMKATIAGLDRHAVVLAPSADASRGVLRNEGFQDADTVARFLTDEKFQQTAKNGVIWVDEAGLMGIRQVREVFDAAEKLNARVVLQGDRRQHGSVERGATLRVLEEYAGLPVAELKDIRRQKGRYKAAVASLAKGDMLAGYDQLADLKWVKETDSHAPLVDEYMAALDTKKTKQKDADRVLVVAPTHAEGDAITGQIRERLKERGRIASEGRQMDVLVPLHWTEAERGDLDRYEGTEVMCFHRNSGTFKAGQTVRIADWKSGDRFAKAAHFSVYAPGSIEVAAGDRLRFTSNGKTKDGKHKLNNGASYGVDGFTKDGDLVLDNGWVVDQKYGHFAHGYVTTSHASQGKTVDRVLIAMGRDSLPAISAEQFYVSVSRGCDKATIYSDLSPVELREAIQKADPRKSATELVGARKPKRRVKTLAERMRAAFSQLREKAQAAISVTRQKEKSIAR
jgi:conjugative relaxase-like TrwC/TraI family protein